jgi:hypothetical protein
MSSNLTNTKSTGHFSDDDDEDESRLAIDIPDDSQRMEVVKPVENESKRTLDTLEEEKQSREVDTKAQQRAVKSSSKITVTVSQLKLCFTYYTQIFLIFDFV